MVCIPYIGIGRGIALKLEECGAQVVAISRTQTDLDSLKQQVYHLRPFNAVLFISGSNDRCSPVRLLTSIFIKDGGFSPGRCGFFLPRRP